MDPVPAGEPGFRFYYPGILFFSLSVFIIVSCREKKKTVHLVYPHVDSTAITWVKQKHEDSLKKLMVKKPKKKVFITFDDGPNRGTRNVYQAVKEENIPATFFIVGKHVFDKPEQYETWIILRGDSTIELCNHSYTHALNHYAHYYNYPDSVMEDFRYNEEKLAFKNKIVRMPGRNAWRLDSMSHTDIKESRDAIDSVRHAGYAIVGWDIEWQFDPKTLVPDSDTALLLRRIHNLLESGSTRTNGALVLLAHDQEFEKEDGLKKLHYVLQQLKNDPDYELMTLSKYPGVKRD